MINQINLHESYENSHIYIYIIYLNIGHGDFHGEDEEPTEDQVSPHFLGGQQIPSVSKWRIEGLI